MNDIRHLIDRYNKKSYNESKRGDKYVWYFYLSDNGYITLNRGIPTKRGLLSDLWIDVEMTKELYNYLVNY